MNVNVAEYDQALATARDELRMLRRVYALLLKKNGEAEAAKGIALVLMCSRPEMVYSALIVAASEVT